jgi:hypothetical protein
VFSPNTGSPYACALCRSAFFTAIRVSYFSFGVFGLRNTQPAYRAAEQRVN